MLSRMDRRPEKPDRRGSADRDPGLRGSARPGSADRDPGRDDEPARPPGRDDEPARAPSDECRFTSDVRKSDCRVRVAAIAARQFGRIRYDQIRGTGAGVATISRWRDAGYLHPVLPRVYAVGHPGTSPEADLAAAVLYAGPDAALSHGTAVWWLGLLRYPPGDEIHVSTPRSVRSLDGIAVHPRRSVERRWQNNLPTTTPARALLDYAATGDTDLLRVALANADYNDLLDAQALLALTGRGIKGSAALHAAIKIHLPELAFARSIAEEELLKFCQRNGLPIPLTNVHVNGWLVDAFWPAHKLIVEIDGLRGHRTRAQLENDHRRDLELRAAGYTVLRYTLRQLRTNPTAVAADLARHLERPQG
jgi:hypothetical protein